MSAQQLPRVWVGGRIEVDNWSLLDGQWDRFSAIDFGEIFVPGNQPRPNIDPSEMDTISTVKVVDWQ